MYEGLMSTLQPVFLMTTPDVDLDLDLKTVVSSSITCNHCRKNAAEVFQESGDFCLLCWQDITYPYPCHTAHLILRTAIAPIHEPRPSIITRSIAVDVKKIALFNEGPCITVKVLSELGSTI
jgi:hypothetical protein